MTLKRERKKNNKRRVLVKKRKLYISYLFVRFHQAGLLIVLQPLELIATILDVRNSTSCTASHFRVIPGSENTSCIKLHS